MDLAEAVRTRLLGEAEVAALVGDRVFWVKRDQGGALPALLLTQISSVRSDLIDGEDEIIETRVQCDCLALTHAASWALAKAVGDVLIEPATIAGESGELDFWNGERSGPIDLGDDTPQGFVHRASLDVLLRHN